MAEFEKGDKVMLTEDLNWSISKGEVGIVIDWDFFDFTKVKFDNGEEVLVDNRKLMKVWKIIICILLIFSYKFMKLKQTKKEQEILLFFYINFNYLFDPASEAGVLASFDEGVLAAFESVVLAFESDFSVVVVEAGVLAAFEFDVVSALFPQPTNASDSANTGNTFLIFIV